MKESNYIFTSDWFSTHIPFFEKRLEQFKEMKDIHFLEVGSYEGRSTCYLMENYILHDKGSTLTCVDTFLGGNGTACTNKQDRIWQNFSHNIKNYPSQQVIVKRGLSRDILKELPLEFYDFIYIDGSHIAPHVLSDAVISFDLLKINGLMTFDDYKHPYVKNKKEVCKAVDAFVSCYEDNLQVVEKNRQLTIKKILNT